MLGYHIGLGANMGRAADTLRRALLCLAADHRLVATSSLYLSRPWGVEDQPPFVNAVARIQTTMTPLELLSYLKDLERALGRLPGRRWGERAIDLDILLASDLVYDGLMLTIPHPRLHERGFVLAPLVEIDPSLVHPVIGQTLAALWEALSRADAPVRLRPRARGEEAWTRLQEGRM